MTQHGVLPSWKGMPGLARVQRSGIPMVVFLVPTGGSGEGSPPLQHELIIPQWKTAESPVGEKVRLKALIFRGKSWQLHCVRLGPPTRLSSPIVPSDPLYPVCHFRNPTWDFPTSCDRLVEHAQMLLAEEMKTHAHADTN